ncbi:hypothetical protein [Oxynema aestuarii]|uniref:Uncharacterized protein n=1 Tax=Oxynema aestuarii AP17 TaxID=2064643 RepID=A0A6H1U0N4_9CYAN|nr:hypothetical protein [Oxynema aestuarii]QIZ72422.1 hypothetical protein HCG48_19050 [Oxynema aestuarii AP17]
MGKKARIKKQRHLQQGDPSEVPPPRPIAADPTEFVRELGRQGYAIERGLEAPSVPKRDDTKGQPQV